MRYIDLESLQLPDGWLDRAAAAATAVVAGADPEDYSSVWRALKDKLADMLEEKCWYCECNVGRSDNAVDHYRPKKRVSDAERPHKGYRWLAFDRTNFRYACTYCNCRRKDVDHGTAGGKADRFPLLNETSRVYTAGSVSGEEPELLDPCDIDDWELIGCKEENGKPCAATNDLIGIRRVETSIEVYHLHYAATCNERHRIIVSFMTNVRLAKSLFPLTGTDRLIRTNFKDLRKQIERAIRRNAPFSGDMYYLLKTQRSDDHPWINSLLGTGL